MKTLSAMGAYGRKANRMDWENGKDFRSYGGAYFSRRDVKLLKDEGYTHVEFKHGGFTVFVVEL